MPSYTFRDKKTDETWDDMMTIAEMEDYLKKNKNIGLVPAAPLIVGSVGQLDSKTDSGWKDQLSRIAERHPESPLADRYGNKSHKALKTKSVLEKHRKRNKTK
jgi:hypothetical protein|tara:strand:+ start:327 stop:635 length:309 start_codon:yes stop_codon:yes gene_type:complete